MCQFLQGDCRTPLHFAAMFGQFSVAKLLLENGANVKALDAVSFNSYRALSFLFYSFRLNRLHCV